MTSRVYSKKISLIKFSKILFKSQFGAQLMYNFLELASETAEMTCAARSRLPETLCQDVFCQKECWNSPGGLLESVGAWVWKLESGAAC